MSEQKTVGSCFCNTVSYQISARSGMFQYCHCCRCRKFTGSAFAANIIISPNDFNWLSGENHIARYEPEATRYFATCFCKCCGSSLPWLNKTATAVVVPAGTLDHDPEVRPMHNIFRGSGAAWYRDPGELPRYHELPPK